MIDSALSWAISQQPRLRAKLEAIVRAEWWADPEVENPMASIPLDGLAWAVGTNQDVQTFVTGHLAQFPEGSLEAGDIGSAVNAVPDETLKEIVDTALPRLQ